MKNILLIKLSTIRARIAILISIQLIFIIFSNIILSYYHTEVIYLENSINIADKNRFLTANLMLKISEYILEGSSNASKVNSAIHQLDSNILTSRQNGKISNIQLSSGSQDFLEDWNLISQKWVSLKSILINNLIKPNEKMNIIISPAVAETSRPTTIDKDIKTKLEPNTFSLLNLSNELITDLDEFAKKEAQNSIFIQKIIQVLNFAIPAALALYFLIKILKPVFALTNATSEVIRGNFNVSVRSRGNDELSVLSDSFNSMMNTIKKFIKKQSELTKELEKVNEELKHKDRLKDEFINLAAHELQGPIQPILGLSEILRDKDLETSCNNKRKKLNEEEILDVIIRNSKRLRYLADDILDVARIENDNLKLEKSTFNLNAEINNVIKDVITEKDLQNQIIQLVFQPKESIIVFADRIRIYQVISNLIRNALKFTPIFDSKIEISLKKIKYANKEFVAVTISDNGKGIDSEILPKIFEKFASKSDKGTGLGLYISRNIIEGSQWNYKGI